MTDYRKIVAREKLECEYKAKRDECRALARAWGNIVYRYMKEGEIKHDPEEKVGCFEQFYGYTLDEIEELIQKEIERREKIAVEMDKELQELDSKLEKCDQIIDAVRQAIIDYQLPTEYILESLRK